MYSYRNKLPLFLSALTESIVAVLPRMKCPHRIEPHQIQGLDFIHIFPVVQVSWWYLSALSVCDWDTHTSPNVGQSLPNVPVLTTEFALGPMGK